MSEGHRRRLPQCARLVILRRTVSARVPGTIPFRQARLACRRRKRGTMARLHGALCACCSGDTGILHRRQFLRVVGIGGATLAIAPGLTIAAEGDYEAMVLACIDPRMQEPVHRYTVEQNLTGKFSQFVIAGAAIGVVAPAFKDWHKAFWDNLATTIQLHRIKRVIAIDHRDCGAAKIAYGEAKVATRRRKPRRTRRRSRNSASRSASVTRSSACRPASWRLTARWRCSAEAMGASAARRSSVAMPNQGAGADEINDADGEDNHPRPLPKAVVGHALDHERRKRGAADR